MYQPGSLGPPANFEEFIRLDCSYCLTWQLNITTFCRYINQQRLRFYPSFIWGVLTAVNRHREFRMEYDERGNLGYFDLVRPEYTVLHSKTKNMES